MMQLIRFGMRFRAHVPNNPRLAFYQGQILGPVARTWDDFDGWISAMPISWQRVGAGMRTSPWDARLAPQELVRVYTMVGAP